MMNIEYVGRNVDLSDDLRAFTEERLQKVARFLVEPVEIRLALETEKSRQIADLHVAHRYGVLQATDESHDMQGTLTAVIEKLEKQARRAKKKAKDKKRRAQRDTLADNSWAVEVVAKESVTEGSKPRIVKSGNIPIKPMSIDEAALALEESRHDFVVFRDATSERVSVLYKRKDENYGLIAPEF